MAPTCCDCWSHAKVLDKKSFLKIETVSVWLQKKPLLSERIFVRHHLFSAKALMAVLVFFVVHSMMFLRVKT